MSNKSQHKISDIFKSKFDEKSNQDLGWNNPPDFLFEEAISTINNNKERKKKRLIFFISALGLIGAVLLNQLYSAHKLNDLETKINHLVSQKQNDRKTKEIVKSIPTNPSKNSKKEDNKIESSKDKTISKAVKNKTSFEGDSPQLISQQNIIAKEIKEEGADFVKTRNSKSFTAPNTTLSILNPLSSIYGNALLSNQNRAKFDYFKDLADTEAVTSKSALKSKLGLHILNNLSTMKMSGPISVQQALTEYDKYYSGIGIGVDYFIPVTEKISLRNSFAYRRIQNQSLINSTLQYSKANEVIMSSNIAMYDMDNTLETPMGTLVERMQLVVDPNSTNDGDMLHHSTSMDQSLSIVNFATGIDASIFSIGKFNWHSGVQLCINYISNLENTFQSRYEMDGKMMGEKNTSINSINNSNHIFGSILFNTGFSYSLSDNLELSLGGTYEKSLNSLRTSDNNSKTFLVSWASQLGLRKSF